MAKKQYTGAKAAIFGLSAAAVVYGTAWLSLHQQPIANSTATESAAVPQLLPTTTGTTSSQQQATSAPTSSAATVPQVTTARAKKSRAS